MSSVFHLRLVLHILDNYPTDSGITKAFNSGLYLKGQLLPLLSRVPL